jgi:hypothetical protein
MRQQPPGTLTAQDIKDTVEDFPLGVLLRSTPRPGLGHQVFDQVPFSVIQIGRIGFSRFHAPRLRQVGPQTQAF